MRWQRDPPCLILQWVDSKVVSMISTTGNANNPGQVKHRVKTADGVWNSVEVTQPQGEGDGDGDGALPM